VDDRGICIQRKPLKLADERIYMFGENPFIILLSCMGMHVQNLAFRNSKSDIIPSAKG